MSDEFRAELAADEAALEAALGEAAAAPVNANPATGHNPQEGGGPTMTTPQTPADPPVTPAPAPQPVQPQIRTQQAPPAAAGPAPVQSGISVQDALQLIQAANQPLQDRLDALLAGQQPQTNQEQIEHLQGQVVSRREVRQEFQRREADAAYELAQQEAKKVALDYFIEHGELPANAGGAALTPEVLIEAIQSNPALRHAIAQVTAPALEAINGRLTAAENSLAGIRAGSLGRVQIAAPFTAPRDQDLSRHLPSAPAPDIEGTVVNTTGGDNPPADPPTVGPLDARDDPEPPRRGGLAGILRRR